MPKQRFKVCVCWRRVFKTRMVEPPLDIKNAFYSFSPSGMITVDDLLRFLIEHQCKKNATNEDAQVIFDSLKHLNIFQRRGLHLEAFFRYLLGLLIHRKIDFCEFRNQFSSVSSVEPIKDVLLRGVRVIELDLWPNSSGNDVNDSDFFVGLQKCLEAIKENTFKASEYPIIITFEDQLNPNLQEKVAKMVTETFEDMLYTNGTENLDQFLSPESLKKKVLISTKLPKEYLEGNTQREEISENEVESTRRMRTVLDEDEEKVVPEYRQLIAINARKLKGGLKNWLSDDPKKVSRISLSKQNLESAAKTYETKTFMFTLQNLLRVYPKRTRLDSSNYNTFVGWMHEHKWLHLICRPLCQRKEISLTIACQPSSNGHGKHLWIMQGMFKANGGCGYVKKPNFLLHKGPNDEDFHHTAFDRYSSPDFYTRDEKQTVTIEDEWLPVWDEEFKFQLRAPKLTVLRIKILDNNTIGRHYFGGQVCLPVS
uniref:Phosphoinositide phospholipase C n=1 Tax=Gossypium raimondii TaxID=29730 RepID=A0A0D2RWX0_GOSRA|nr:hypothetical protein B456_009G091400 [Gossypium raimondii]